MNTRTRSRRFFNGVNIVCKSRNNVFLRQGLALLEAANYAKYNDLDTATQTAATAAVAATAATREAATAAAVTITSTTAAAATATLQQQ